MKMILGRKRELRSELTKKNTNSLDLLGLSSGSKDTCRELEY